MAALKYLIGTATQASADAFISAEITTGLSATQNTAFRVRSIDFYGLLLPGADANYFAAVTRKDFSAMPAYSERSIIAYVGKSVELTTSGMVVQDPLSHFKFDADDDLLIVEDPIYLVADSAGTAASNVFTVRIGYHQVRISEVDRLTLVAASLAS